MSEQVTRQFEQTRGREYWLPCGQCSVETKHVVLRSVDLRGTNGYVDWDEGYQIIQCKGCETYSFRKSWMNSEDYEPSEDAQGLINPERDELYPPRVAGRPELRDTILLSFQVRAVYEETYKALCNDQTILAGMGIRALIEPVCQDKNASGDNLAKKIDDLVQIGVLTSSGAKILHSLRIMGNQATHEAKPHSSDDLSIALDVVENLLQNVYIIPERAERLARQPRRECN